MKAALVAVLLEDLGRDALKVGFGLVGTLVIALAFVVASLTTLLSAALGATPPMPQTQPLPAPVDDAVVQLAYAQLGMPYVWGGASPQTSFDCSGLVQWVYRQVGVTLPRTAQQQYNVTAPLAPDELQPGDLVFFEYTYPGERITHVGIYIGSGRMINAPTTGDVVRIMPIFSDPYWNAHYAGAGRVRR